MTSRREISLSYSLLLWGFLSLGLGLSLSLLAWAFAAWALAWAFHAGSGLGRCREISLGCSRMRACRWGIGRTRHEVRDVQHFQFKDFGQRTSLIVLSIVTK